MRIAINFFILLLFAACGGSSKVRYIVEGEGTLSITYTDENAVKNEIEKKEVSKAVFITIVMPDNSFTAELTVKCATEIAENTNCRLKAARIEVGEDLVSADEGGSILGGPALELYTKAKCSEGALGQTCQAESRP